MGEKFPCANGASRRVFINRSNKRSILALAAASAVAGIAGYGQTARAGTVVENGSANSLSSGGAWVGGVAPASTDIAQFGNSITGAYSQPLGSSTNWGEIQVLNPGGPITISPDGSSLTITGIAQATGTLGIDMSAATQSLTINSGLILGSTQLWNVASGQTLNIGGVISDGGNAYGFNANGPGTVSLTAANTYTGVTQVSSGGTLVLDFSSGAVPSNIVNSGSTLTLGGIAGGNLVINNGSSSSSPTQAFNGLTLNRGANSITISNSGTGLPAINLGAITGNTGGTVQFNGLASATGATGTSVTGVGTISATGRVSVSGAAPVTGSGLLVGTNGGALGTVGLYDWAALSGGQVVSANTIPGFYLLYPQAATSFNGTTLGNLDLSGTVKSHNQDNESSIRFNTNATVTCGIVSAVGTNGILMTPNVGANNSIFNTGTGVIDSLSASFTAGPTPQLTIIQNDTAGMLLIDGIGNVATGTVATLVQSGAGTVYMTNPSTYTGQTYLNGGTLEVLSDGGLGATGTAAQVNMAGGGVFGSASFAFAAGRNFALSGPGGTLSALTGTTMTVPGIISGSAPLNIGVATLPGTGVGTANTTAQNGNGFVAITGTANTYTGGTNVNAGTLQVDAATGTPLGTGNVNVNSGGILGGVGTITNAVKVASGGAITGGDGGNGGTLTVGNLSLASGSIFDVNFNGAASNSEVALSNGASIAAGALVDLFIGGSTTAYDYNGTYTLFNLLSGSLTGANNLSVGNPQAGSTYTFNTSGSAVSLTISGGAILPVWTGASGTSWNTAGDWSTNAVPSAQSTTVFFNSAGAGSITLDASQTVGIINLNSATGYTFNQGSGGTLSLDNASAAAQLNDVLGSHTFNVPIQLNSNLAVLVTNATDSLSLTGAISGATGITLSGLGTLALSGSNSYSGGTTVNSGTLGIAADASLGAVPGSPATNLTFNPGAGATAGLITTAGTTLNVNRNITVQSGLTKINNSGFTDVINGVISGSGAVTYSGAGSTNLAGANTNSGTSVIAGGSLLLSNTAALQLTTLNYNNQGGSLSFGSLTAATLGGLTGSQALALTNASAGAVNLSVGNANGTNTFSGALGGNGSLTIIGTGLLAINGTNTYSGSTNLNNGTLDFAVGSLPAGTALNFNGGNLQWAPGNTTDISNRTLTFAGNANLDTNGNNVTLANAIGNTGTGSLLKNGNGVLTLTGADTATGGIQANVGTIILGPGGTFNGTFANTANNATLEVAGGTLTSSALSTIGTGSLGLDVISGTATFNGGLIENLAGTNTANIQVTGTGVLNASNITIGRTLGIAVSSLPTAAFTANGLYINGGTVNLTGAFNMGNSTATGSDANARVDSGSFTVGGVTIISEDNATRWSVYQVNGGTYTSNDTSGVGVLVGGGFGFAGTNDEFLVTGGVSTVPEITYGNAAQTSGTDAFTLNGGTVFIGAGGIVSGVTPPTTYTELTLLGNGTLGATASWASSLPITLTDASIGTTILTAGASGAGHNITLSGVVSGSGNLIVSGTGSLNLSGANTYTGTTKINAGTLILSSPTPVTLSGAVANAATLSVTGTASLGPISGAGVTNVASTGSLSTAQLIQSSLISNGSTSVSGTGSLGAISGLGSLNIGAAGNVALTETQGTSSIGALNLTGNGTFDVTNNALLINYSAAGQTSPDAAIRSALISGSGTNGVTYNGVGIISSTAARLNAALVANNGTPAYGVGYADGSDPYLNNEGPAAGVEEVKLTLLGDLNLDGFVNSADFILFANSFGKTGGTAAAWDHGDLNYDGSVNSADFILFADEFGKGLGTVSSTDGGLTLAQGGLDAAQVQQFNQIGTDLGISSTELAQLDLKVAAVPEPASLGLLVIGGLGLMGRRRRRNA